MLTAVIKILSLLIIHYYLEIKIIVLLKINVGKMKVIAIATVIVLLV